VPEPEPAATPERLRVTAHLLAGLLDDAHLATSDKLATVVAHTCAPIGWVVRVYLVDYEQRHLVPLPADGFDDLPTEDIEGTVAGRAFRTIEVRTTDASGTTSMWVPVLDGVERLGVLHIVVSDGLDTDDSPDVVRWLAHMVGHLIGGKSLTGDYFHRVRGSAPRTVASELIWSLLPPLMVASNGIVVAGLLEPAHRVAGDAFDYALDATTAHVGIIDATGHDLGSAVIGALTLATYRNSRRRDLSLVETTEHIDNTLAEHALDTYATGVFGRLDLASGIFRYVNAGHPAPLLMRDGRVVRSLDEGRRILLGASGPRPTVAEERLEPGDWVVFYTDGIPEARDADRNFFGEDRFVDILERCAANGQTAAETVRRVTHSVLEHQHGVLQDDATIMVIQWASALERKLTA
jgi:sigma-B regulation protein RsbU (phosphoserine phosphatase)